MSYNKTDAEKADTFDLQIVNNLPFLKKIAAKYIRNEEEAKDLIQETLYKALKNKHRFKADTNLKGWLATVLKNTFINLYNKKKCEKYRVDFDKVALESEPLHDPVLNPISPLFGIDDKYHSSDNYNVVVKSLPDEIQKLIQMCDIEGFSYQQIAEYLNCPVGTVRSRLYRNRKSLVRTYHKFMSSEKI